MKPLFSYLLFLAFIVLPAHSSFVIDVTNISNSGWTGKIMIYYTRSIAGDKNAIKGHEYKGTFHGNVHEGTSAKIILPSKDFLVTLVPYWSKYILWSKYTMYSFCYYFIPQESLGPPSITMYYRNQSIQFYGLQLRDKFMLDGDATTCPFRDYGLDTNSIDRL